jgi:hypothetical protein
MLPSSLLIMAMTIFTHTCFATLLACRDAIKVTSNLHNGPSKKLPFLWDDFVQN